MKKYWYTIVSLVVILATVNIAVACGCGCKGESCGETLTQNTDTKGKVQCPVMKSWFVPNEETPKAEYEGKTYYFCCPGCKPSFLENPEKYLKEKNVS